MNWHIGQEVIALHNAKEIIKKGDVREINAITQFCKHYPVLLDVGIAIPVGRPVYMTCPKCNAKIRHNGTYWCNAKLFAPLDSIADISELQDVLKAPVYQ